MDLRRVCDDADLRGQGLEVADGMNYFEARSHERCVRKFRDHVELYWAGDDRAPKDRQLRERFAEVNDCVRALGFNPVWTGVARSIADTSGNYVSDVLSDRQGRKEGSGAFLDLCVGSARLARRRARNRLLSPWCWPVDLLGMLIAFPVRAMRVAGLPQSQEREYWIKFIGLAFWLAVAVLGTVLGLNTAFR